MKTVVILLALVACYVSSSLAANCNGKFQQYRKCLQKARPQQSQQDRQAQQAKLQGLKAQVDACFTNNNCKPPQQAQNQGSGNSNNQVNAQCKKDITALYRQKLTTCLKENGVSYPQDNANDNQGGKGQGGGKAGKRPGGAGDHDGGAESFKYNPQATQAALNNCPQKAAVQTCMQAAVKANFGGQNGGGAADRKAQLQAFCTAKAQCDNQLGAECKAEMDKERKAACQCLQQQDPQQLIAQVPSCQALAQSAAAGGNVSGGGKERRQPKKINCDQIHDPCQSGGQPFGQNGIQHQF